MEAQFGNLMDAESVSRAVDGTDIVIHIAAWISIPYSYPDHREVFDVNATGTINVLQACLHHGTKRVVTTSTSEVYGSADNLPIKEDHPEQSPPGLQPLGKPRRRTLQKLSGA